LSSVTTTTSRDHPRLLVVSHPAVLAANQVLYEELALRGWEVHLIVPGHWRHEYAADRFPPIFLPRLAPRARGVRVAFEGAPQRHIYLSRPASHLDRVAPDIVFLEQEPFALVTGQWLWALSRRRIPFVLQQDENLERKLPLIARLISRLSLRNAAAVAARSPRAAELIHQKHPEAVAPVVPHSIMDWGQDHAGEPGRLGPQRLTVGFAGRLIESKGIRDLLEATARMHHPAELVLFGSGPLEDACLAASSPQRPVSVITDVSHDQMHDAYAQMDILVLPSRTTPTWAEQFGRVLVEAMSCGRPVVGSDSGEIPWVIGTTGGGRVFREGDVEHLRATLDELAADPELRHGLGSHGREAVQRTFSLRGVTDATEAMLVDALRKA
jgi:glycosyltransferase involved in cell wall biosynthesis